MSGEGDKYTRIPRADDADQDFLADAYDPDDDNDGILDVADASHPSNAGELDSDGDQIIDTYDPDDDNDNVLDEQDIDPLNAPTDPTTPQPGDHDGDHLIDEFDPDHINNHGIWSQALQDWQDIDINWEALDGQP